MFGLHRLKRQVAPVLRSLAGWRRPRALTGRRPISPSRGLRATLFDVAALAWPITLAMLGETAMGLIDTHLVGVLGAPALGGVGIASTLMYLQYATVFGVMRAVKVRSAHALGENRVDDGVRYAQAGMLLGLGAGVCAFALTRDVTWALKLLRVDPALIPYARDFLAARTFGAPMVCMVSAMSQHRQGIGDTRAAMRSGLMANVLNAALAWSLIEGHLGLPALGVRGAGFATAAAETLQFLYLGSLLRSDLQKPVVRGISLRRALAEVCSLGLPTGAQFGVETLAFTALTALLASMGPVQIAAHQISLSTLRVSFLPGIAIAEAASVLVGKSLGARNLREADRVLRAALLLASGFMVLCGLVFASAGAHIAAGFTHDPAVVSVVVELLLVAALFQLFDAVNIVLRGALRGARDVRLVSVAGPLIVWVCVPGSALVLGRWLHLGAVGAWYGFLFETVLASAVFGWRWQRGAWRANYSAAPRPADIAVAGAMAGG